MSCPVLDPETASVAQALRVVDCTVQQGAATAFGRLFGLDGALLTALTILLTLYVAWLAFGLLTGRATLGLSALTPRMMTVGLVLTFVTSWVAYQSVVWSLVVGAPDQVASIIMGTKGSATEAFGARVDLLFNAVAEAARAAGPAQAATATPRPGSFTAVDLLWLSALMLLLGTVGVLVTAKIAVGALLAVGPVFIVLALFGGTRGLFEGWLKAAVLFAVVPLFAVVLGGGALELAVPVVRALSEGGGQLAERPVGVLFLIAAVYLALMVMVLKLATTLVSGWRLPGSARAEGAPALHTASSVQVAGPAVGPVGSNAAGEARPVATDRARAVVAGLAQPANDTGSSRTNVARTIAVRGAPTGVQTGAIAPALTGGTGRARGIGSRFRAAPPPIMRKP